MTDSGKAARGGIWFASVNLITQGLSWVMTFYVIRLLTPDDYGLMNMASFFTSYLQMVADLGLGSAIVQRKVLTEHELSSVFWLSLAVGLAMALAAFALAYPTAWLFSEPRVIPVTYLISTLFLTGALTTVPYSLLARRYDFKKIAIANFLATMSSSVLSIVLALKGYGVYTLILTNIAMNATRLICFMLAARWRPQFHYSRADVGPYVSYGVFVAMAASVLRLFQTVDRVIVGRIFGAASLGLYGNAMTVASMPLDKIWTKYQQISFPLLSRADSTTGEREKIYLGMLTHILLTIAPVCVGSALVANELISAVLGVKWLPMVAMFQVFCVAKLWELLTSYHAVLFNASENQRRVLWFNMALVATVPPVILLAARHSMQAILFPWGVVYPLVCAFWIFRNLKEFGIPRLRYLRTVYEGLQATIGMTAVLLVVKSLGLLDGLDGVLLRLVALVCIGGASYLLMIVAFQRPLLLQAINTLRQKT